MRWGIETFFTFRSFFIPNLKKHEKNANFNQKIKILSYFSDFIERFIKILVVIYNFDTKNCQENKFKPDFA